MSKSKTKKPCVVVWLTEDGLVDYTATPDVDVAFIDFGCARQGDADIYLSDDQRELLSKDAPEILEEIQEILDSLDPAEEEVA
jgi:hypothetical protein